MRLRKSKKLRSTRSGVDNP